MQSFRHVRGRKSRSKAALFSLIVVAILFFTLRMSNDRYLRVSRQPLAVDFVENRMSKYHPAFDTSNIRWSHGQNQFVTLVPWQQSVAVTVHDTLDVPSQPAPRPLPEPIHDMNFWEDVLPPAIQKLSLLPTPKHGANDWNIRGVSAWKEVEDKLELAQQHYNFRSDRKHVQSARSTMRRFFDKVQPTLSQAVKATPHTDSTAVVITVFNFVLDVGGFCLDTKNSHG